MEGVCDSLPGCVASACCVYSGGGGGTRPASWGCREVISPSEEHRNLLIKGGSEVQTHLTASENCQSLEHPLQRVGSCL